MSKSSYTTVYTGPGFLTLLAIVFVYFKLSGQIAWSWAAVLAPVWGPAAFLLAVYAIIFVALGLASLFNDH